MTFTNVQNDVFLDDNGFILNDISGSSMDYSEYPTCVDESDYRPDAEQLRSLKITGQVASVSPVYDTDGDINSITDDIVTLRQGKLDKAEVETLRKNIIDSSVLDGKKAHDKAVSDAIDSTLGVNSVNEGN